MMSKFEELADELDRAYTAFRNAYAMAKKLRSDLSAGDGVSLGLVTMSGHNLSIPLSELAGKLDLTMVGTAFKHQANAEMQQCFADVAQAVAAIELAMAETLASQGPAVKAPLRATTETA